jgi:hypothetical protein
VDAEAGTLDTGAVDAATGDRRFGFGSLNLHAGV